LHAFTHSVVWASVIASVFFAAFVTLLIEYFAKPGLEARKDRILDKGRQRRDAINGTRRANLLAFRFLTYKDHPKMVEATSVQADRIAAEIAERTLTAFEYIDVPKSISREWEYVTSSMNAYATTFPAYTIALPAASPDIPGEYWEGLKEALLQLKDFEDLFFTTKWHPWRRRKLIKKIKSSVPSDLKAVEESGNSSSSSHQEETRGLCP